MRLAWGLVGQEGDLDRSRAHGPNHAIFPINHPSDHRLRDITVSDNDLRQMALSREYDLGR
jgi:hypothetical protein